MTQVKQEIQNMVVWGVFVFLPVKDNLIPLQFAFVFFFIDMMHMHIWSCCVFVLVTSACTHFCLWKFENEYTCIL